MYNPNELKLEYSHCYDNGASIQDGTVEQKAVKRKPRTLSVNLTFDGTAASPTSAAAALAQNVATLLGEYDVHKEVTSFLQAMKVDSEKHAPLYVMVVWGKIKFPCVITAASVTYKLFRNDGVPLRAVVSVSMLEHVDEVVYKSELRLLSPDLTRAHVIIQGDRIDALCEKFYGDPSLYHEVARVNNLTNTRKLIPGNTLVFPPIDKRN
jgi:nucleoid-associated protein YgaU